MRERKNLRGRWRKRGVVVSARGRRKKGRRKRKEKREKKI